ncbi:N-acetylglucosamine kinase [Rhizobium puerariae]|uniref:N-acetylglucosamine kinase n=1 Tax=Rhizobium puerariae TaxID=1585791 RepID=A0ABV6AA84_9HYPH
MSEIQTPLLVGIDAGGSKMHIQVASALDGSLLADEVHPSTGWANLGDAKRADILLSVVETTTATLGKPVVVVAGVHGNDSPEQEAQLRAPLASRYPVVRILNDSSLLILAYGKSSGTGVIAGTGSSATATVGDQTVTVGGWGWIFGDEGGAVGIVRDAAKQVLEAYDLNEQDLLTEDLLHHFGIDHPHGLTHMFSTIEPHVWARAAQLVFKSAERGSVRAQKVIDAHAVALAELIALLKRRGGDVETIVCAGGVITGQPVLFNAFTREVHRLVDPSTETALLLDPPVRGALNLANHIHITSQSGTTRSDRPVADRISI